MNRWKWRAKRTWHRLDNPELRNARHLMRAIRGGDIDVVYISESTAIYVGVDDGDSRHLGQTVRELLEPHKMHLTSGPGYLSDMLGAYMHLLTAAPRPPVVIHPIWVRGTFIPWVENPLYQRTATVAAVNALDPTMPLWRVHGSFPRNDDYTEHEKIRYTTFGGEKLVGDYTRPLRAMALRDPERQKLLYEYHYTGTPDPRGLASVTALGKAVRESGCRSVAYQTPVSVQLAAELLGGDRWTEHHRENVRLVHEAYVAGRGPEGRVVECAWDFTPDEYVDPFDGVEHLNGAGRAHMAKLVADAVKEELAARDASHA